MFVMGDREDPQALNMMPTIGKNGPNLTLPLNICFRKDTGKDSVSGKNDGTLSSGTPQFNERGEQQPKNFNFQPLEKLYIPRVKLPS
jgi:hypothetical protein